jgi:hypothetical protein
MSRRRKVQRNRSLLIGKAIARGRARSCADPDLTAPFAARGRIAVPITSPYPSPAGVGPAYIYNGGTSVDATPDVTLNGGAGGDKFGSSVSSSGDVNGDGYADVIVGASGCSSGAGRACVFHGGVSMDTSADLTFNGMDSTNAEAFGRSVSVRDVTGDGKGDILVGAPLYSIATSATPLTGEACVYFGDGNNMRDSNTGAGSYQNTLFGWSMD